MSPFRYAELEVTVDVRYISQKVCSWDLGSL